MSRVVTSGTFDIIHPGHLLALYEMKKLGDELYVVVISNETVEKNKGIPPVFNQEERGYMVESMKPVDRAITPPHNDTNYEEIKRLNPDIYAYGYDQMIPWLAGLIAYLSERGYQTEFKQVTSVYDDGNCHSSIIKELIKRGGREIDGRRR